MKKRRFINNKGFTLVETIIVIAIIAVMSGIAMVTLTLMHSAKAKEAGVTFESEVSNLSSKAKGKSCDLDGNGVLNSSPVTVVSNGANVSLDEANCRYAIRVYKHTNGNYYVQNGYYKKDTGAFVPVDSENKNDGDGANLSSHVVIKYTSYAFNASTNQYDKSTITVDDTGVVIVFDKEGACISGAGDFGFYKKNGNNIARVTINKNGSHQSN